VSGSILGKAAAGIGALVLAVAVLAGGAAAGVSGLLGGSGDGTGIDAEPAMPSAYLLLYESAAATCPGLSWSVLAAIGTVESDNGQSTARGVHSGANNAGAEGPMQFEPATFAAYEHPIPSGGVRPASPYDAVDAIYAAARMLCANGARNGQNLDAAIYDYNHATWYVTDILTLAATYAATFPTGAAAIAVDYALSQLGVPYKWGGEDPGVAFDCSGLVQASYARAGIALPRTAQEQFDAGPRLPAGTTLEPGDLVFYGTSARGVTHVGIVIDTHGDMVDAPHTGADVRTEPIWPGILGATRPAGLSRADRAGLDP
jgi:cell wall-associated NlpC family hydrolase